jgi:hypothetical protein
MGTVPARGSASIFCIKRNALVASFIFATAPLLTPQRRVASALTHLPSAVTVREHHHDKGNFRAARR